MKYNLLVNINSGYIKYFLTMVNSLTSSNKDKQFTIYVMHSNLTDEHKALIRSKVSENVELEYIYMDNALFKGAPKVKRYPYEIYYRIFAPKMLPETVDKILYLDSDLIVHNDISSLYNIDFEGNYFVNCTQIGGFLTVFNRIRMTVGKGFYYPNTGVMLMNVKELRDIIDIDKIFKFIKSNGYRMALYDQDVIFKFYGNKIKLIDPKIYNLSDRYVSKWNFFKRKQKIDHDWVEKNNVIVHYLGRNKPWKDNYKGILKDFYTRYKIDI